MPLSRRENVRHATLFFCALKWRGLGKVRAQENGENMRRLYVAVAASLFVVAAFGKVCPDCQGRKCKWVKCEKCDGAGQLVSTKGIVNRCTHTQCLNSGHCRISGRKWGTKNVSVNAKCPACSNKSTATTGKGKGKVKVDCQTCGATGSVD